MARPKRPPWQVEQTKNKIFQATLELFNRQGYEAVTIRKIARRAGCSPATIYNYYSDKDALYLDILTEGFAILYQLLQAEPRSRDPLVRLRAYTAVFYRFSLDHPYYYDIMFSFHVPKYLDYAGTPAEETAFAEKEVALKNIGLILEAMADFYRGCPALRSAPGMVTGRALTLLGTCHGIISLHRSGIWAELETDFSALYFSAVDDYLQKLTREKEELLAGEVRLRAARQQPTGEEYSSRRSFWKKR
ncbi:MAG: TetR/AcrR family transcriptional regulator [Firmicutes bacterium]|nr:TetR/AcrR family transcriptional regulator [Bacillota bacterium]